MRARCPGVMLSLKRENLKPLVASGSIEQDGALRAAEDCGVRASFASIARIKRMGLMPDELPVK